MLALDRASRDFYAKLQQPASHADWIAYEVAATRQDHAGYSAMLLKSWNLPERICKTVAASHEPQTLDATTDEGRFARCVALGSDLAEAVVATDRARPRRGARAARRQAARHEPRDLH